MNFYDHFRIIIPIVTLVILCNVYANARVLGVPDQTENNRARRDIRICGYSLTPYDTKTSICVEGSVKNKASNNMDTDILPRVSKVRNGERVRNRKCPRDSVVLCEHVNRNDDLLKNQQGVRINPRICKRASFVYSLKITGLTENDGSSYLTAEISEWNWQADLKKTGNVGMIVPMNNTSLKIKQRGQIRLIWSIKRSMNYGIFCLNEDDQVFKVLRSNKNIKKNLQRVWRKCKKRT